MTEDRVLEVAVEAARAGGEVALKYYRSGVSVAVKADGSPVTRADQESEKAIRDILGRAHPAAGFLGEEFGETGPQDERWIVDPIDGTRNFVRGIPFWATLIGLEEQGEITLGVIYSALTGDLYTARRGGGAFLNGARLRVSDTGELGRALLVHATLSGLRAAGTWEAFTRLVDATERQRGFGDYLGFTLLAEGRAEIYVEVAVKPWDLAPCKILVEEAGGRFTDFAGRPTIYGGTALASNGRLHEAALALLRAV